MAVGEGEPDRGVTVWLLVIFSRMTALDVTRGCGVATARGRRAGRAEPMDRPTFGFRYRSNSPDLIRLKKAPSLPLSTVR